MKLFWRSHPKHFKYIEYTLIFLSEISSYSSHSFEKEYIQHYCNYKIITTH